MNTTEEVGSWNERKERLKKKFGFLTDNDLMFDETPTDEMLARLQRKLGKTKDELLRILAMM
jgi:uncharacterized protein YjbJ (UPF0337 family)